MDDNLRGRYRRDFTKPPVNRHPMQPTVSRPAPESDQTTLNAALPAAEPVQLDKHISKKRRFSLKKLIIFIVILAVLAAAGWLLLLHKKPSPPAAKAQPVVPSSISSAVNIPVYYPDPKKLPAGYYIDDRSFILPDQKNGVAYAVRYDGSKKIEVTVQARPADSELDNVNKNYIPLRTEYQTPVGLAEIGIYNQQTFVSLPVANGPWIILTAPTDIDRGQLNQVLSALRHP